MAFCVIPFRFNFIHIFIYLSIYVSIYLFIFGGNIYVLLSEQISVIQYSVVSYSPHALH